MPDREMTPQEAIIVLDRLNTEERISVDRDELRAAIEVAKMALRKQIQAVPIIIKTKLGAYYPQCPSCNRLLRGCDATNSVCSGCGQALNWRAHYEI